MNNDGQSVSGDLKLGNLRIPLSDLPLEHACPTVEKWFQLDTDLATLLPSHAPDTRSIISTTETKTNNTTRRSPSVLLQISFCSGQMLNEKEEEPYVTINDFITNTTKEESTRSRSNTLGSMVGKPSPGPAVGVGTFDTSNLSQSLNRGKSQLKQQQRIMLEETELIRQNGPFLEAGIIDYISVVGVHDFGKVQNDDGSKGWLNVTPQCSILEQFPNDDFHSKHGRTCTLSEIVDLWCFPEGCKLWRGPEPPTHMDMNLKRFSASSPPSMASSIAAFDACLNCTTSFLWWVTSSNSDEYGSKLTKTFGAVIRFYVPAPKGVDLTTQVHSSKTVDGATRGDASRAAEGERATTGKGNVKNEASSQNNVRGDSSVFGLQ